MIDSKLDKYDQILIDNRIFPIRPRSHACAAAALIGIFSSGVQFVVTVRDGVNVMITKFGTLVIEGVFIGQNFLERGRVDFVGDGFTIDGVAFVDVLDFESAIDGIVDVVASAGFYDGFLGKVACAVRVEVGAAWHG